MKRGVADRYLGGGLGGFALSVIATALCRDTRSLTARAILCVNMVQTSLLAAVLGLLVVQAIGIAAVLLRFRRKAGELEASFRAFVTPPNDKTPSQLAMAIDQISQIAGRAIVAQAKATFMGEASAASRMAARAEGQEQLAKVPWLASIAALVPGFSKSLLKNPALAAGIAQLFGKTSRPGQVALDNSPWTSRPGQVGPNNGHGGDQASMDMKIGG